MPRLRLNRLPAQLTSTALSGLILFAAQPPLDLWFLAFIALVPLLWALRDATPVRGLVIGFTFGFTYLGLVMYWILLFGEFAWFGIAISCGAAVAVFGFLAPVIRRRRPAASALSLAALWTGIEFLRSMWPLGGLTWGDIAYTQAGDRLLLPLASVTGAWGITFVVVLVNALLLEAVIRWGSARRTAASLIGGALLATLAPSFVSIPEPNGTMLDTVALQVRVPKEVALTPAFRVREIANRFIALHRSLSGPTPELVIWPEDSLDKDPALDPSLAAAVDGAIREIGAPTLVGGIMGPPRGRTYNQGVLFDAQANVVGRYSKTHLVPFGEYVPWRDQLGFLELLQQIPRDLTPGLSPRTLSLDGMRFGNVICFENAFPSIARQLVDDGAGFLVVSTNNASYLATAASDQHLAMSRLRAVENGRWVVHAAISGISAFIDPDGGVHQPTALFQQAVNRMSITTSTRRTLYTRLGDWFPATCLFFSAALVLLPHRRRRSASATPRALPPGSRALVILPTYNERATIKDVVTSVLAIEAPLDILVVDDGSPDGTGDLVAALAEGEPRVTLLRRPRKTGLASAYAQGFSVALSGGYALAVEMDSDLSHDPAELPALLAAAQANDLTIGSRYVPRGSVTNWSRLRTGLSRAGNFYARFCLGFPLTDSTSGYRVYRTELLRRLLEDGIHAEGYGFQVELAFRAWKLGYAIGEVPITFREREHGHSKISRRIVVEAMWQVTRWGLKERFGRW